MKKNYLYLFTAVGILFLYVIDFGGIKTRLFYGSHKKKVEIVRIKKEELKPVKPTDINISKVQIECFENDTHKGLNAFIDNLKSASGGKQIRIAHFGDSMIEGDLITNNLRSLLQTKFGEGGIGFIPITSEAASFRGTIGHTFSRNWIKYSLLYQKPAECRFGISGYVFKTGKVLENSVPEDYPYVQYTLGNDKSDRARLFYSLSGETNYTVEYSLDGGEYLSAEIIPNEKVGELNIDLAGARKIKFRFVPDNNLSLYGVSFENSNGVIVDNFPVRGHSGLQLNRINSDILNEFNSMLHYDLVILQYGANVTNESMEDFSWYEAGMIKIISHLQASMPGASFLVVSTADRAYKNAKGYYSSPTIKKIVNAQKNVAQRTRSSFWNLYETMGGQNSMLAWKEKNLASADYIHLNHSGAQKVGTLLFSALMQKIN